MHTFWCVTFCTCRVALDYQQQEVVLSFPHTRALLNDSSLQSSVSKSDFFYHEFVPSEIHEAEVKLGVLFIVHQTNQLPSDSSPHFRQHLNFTKAVIFPQQTIISDKLMRMSPHRRNCFLEHERSLELFKVYSKHNCEHECQSFAFAEQCGCVPFYLLRELRWRKSLSLKSGTLRAFDNNSRKIIWENVWNWRQKLHRKCQKRVDIETGWVWLPGEMRWADLQSCPAAVCVVMIWPWLWFCNQIEEFPFCSFKCVLYVQIASDSYQPFEKISSFTFFDFLGNIGGFMGLLAGISLLSVVEIFYHVAAFNIKVSKNTVHPLVQSNRRIAWANENHVLFQLMRYFNEFVKSSDIHGLKYTQSQETGKFSRIFWSTLVLLSLMICFATVSNVYRQDKSPLVTRIDPTIWTLDDVRNISVFVSKTQSRIVFSSDPFSNCACRTQRLLQIIWKRPELLLSRRLPEYHPRRSVSLNHWSKLSAQNVDFSPNSG